MSATPPAAGAAPRQLFLDALRAVASLVILWHHFALYPPLREWAAPIAGGVLDWLERHGRATQVFFVVGGYVMARGMAPRRWSWSASAAFMLRRYLRLGVPYLATILLVLPLYAWGRGWIPEEVLGTPVTLPQFLAHLVFMQEILGYEHLSAGIWFVCINFQLSFAYAATLVLRDSPLGRRLPDLTLVIGWLLAAASLFMIHPSGSADHWAPYFHPYFFMGVLIHHAVESRHRGLVVFVLYQLLLAAALVHVWRWRLVSAMVAGLLLFAAQWTGFGARWPRGRVFAALGRVSYSLFLIHFPVLVLVSTLWARCGWHHPAAALAGLLTAFGLSLAAAFAFHRWVEAPSAHLIAK